MLKINASRSRGLCGKIVGVGMLLMTTIATPALASQENNLTVLDTNISNSGSLSTNAGGNNYYAMQTVTGSPTCVALSVSTDTLKAWQSQLNAALLSGKTVTIIYTSAQCNGESSAARWLQGVRLHG